MIDFQVHPDGFFKLVQQGETCVETVLVANTEEEGRRALRYGLSNGWTLLSFDFTVPKPVIIFAAA